MNVIKCFSQATRIAILAKCTDPLTWQELHTLLPALHKHLTCRKCHKLLDQLNPYKDGFVCAMCVDSQITGSTSCIILPLSIIQSYKTLCSFIRNSPLYKVMCTRVEDNALVELITEVIGVPRPVNGFSRLVNSTVIKQEIEEKEDSKDNITLTPSTDGQLSIENQTSNDHANLQIFDVQSQKHRTQNQSVFNDIPKKKKYERRWVCRCGNATNNPGKLTCFGQRCSCYTEQRPCGDRCKCKGCRNPNQKQSNNDDHLEIDQVRRKPVTLELSSLKPSNIKSEPDSYTMHDMLNFPSHSQDGTEVSLGHVNSIFHSP